MSVFADSSALVKLYVDEEGSAEVAALEDVVVSALARVEVPAALWRKQRAEHLDVATVGVLVGAFEADLPGAESPGRFAVVAPTPRVLDDAARLAGIHGLRACDAVHLASARAAAAADDRCRVLVAFDRALRDAAAAEGFALVP